MEEKQVKLVVQKDKYDLEITPELEKKIRYLCNKFPQREWSGILFYDYAGAFSEGDIKFIAKDFYFMDEGDATTTEFDLDSPDVVSYMCDNDLFGCQLGLLHSHHSISAFFSGQDDSMLKQEGSKRNHFLSLVVNNKREYVARVTSKEIYKYTIQGICEFKTFNDTMSSRNVLEEREQCIISAYDLNIHYPNIESEYAELDERIEECRKKKEEKKKSEACKIGNIPRTVWPMAQQTLPFKEKEYKVSDTPTVKEVIASMNKPVQSSIKKPSESIITEEMCADYAAQLLTLDFLATKDCISRFLPEMEQRIEDRFIDVDQYREMLHFVGDQILDFELGDMLLMEADDKEVDVDTLLAEAKLEIASYIEDVTKSNKNDYINLILEYLYE